MNQGFTHRVKGVLTGLKFGTSDPGKTSLWVITQAKVEWPLCRRTFRLSIKMF